MVPTGFDPKLQPEPARLHLRRHPARRPQLRPWISGGSVAIVLARADAIPTRLLRQPASRGDVQRIDRRSGTADPTVAGEGDARLFPGHAESQRDVHADGVRRAGRQAARPDRHAVDRADIGQRPGRRASGGGVAGHPTRKRPMTDRQMSRRAYGRANWLSTTNWAQLNTGMPRRVRPSYRPRWAWPCTTAFTFSKRSTASASRDEPRKG